MNSTLSNVVPGATLCLLVTTLLPTGSVYAQGRFSPVTDTDVVALKFNHYFTADKRAHDADFEWSFTKTDFVMKKGKGPIATDLLDQLLPKGTMADEIRGKWKLSKDGKLVLSEIRAGETPGKEEVSLVIYKTAPTVVRIGDRQYVFGIDR